MTTRLREIKLEGNELQSYIETYDKDLDGQQTITLVQASGENDGDEDEDEGTYFVDQSGNYYYQATKDSDPVLAEPSDGENIQYIVEEDDDGTSLEQTENIEEHEEIITGDVIAPKARRKKSAAPKVASSEYEGITYDPVPDENNDGDVSYVFIMDGDKPGLELEEAGNIGATGEGVNDDEEEEKVYEFEEEEEAEEAESSEAKKPKRKTIVRAPKKSQVSLAMHMCNYCNYTSPKRYLLSRHMKSHSEERPYKCSVCERGFKTLASLQNHVNTHTGTKPHLCKFCESCFTTSGELVRHVRYRHTHEKPHKCHECDYASVELSKLKRHIRCHTGERPYQCPHCTYASPDTFKLKRHLRIHTGEKPYECDVCQARFTQSNSLKAHKLIHSVGDKPVFHCELCPTTCGRKTDLRIHVQKLHTAEKPLKCKRCGNSFPDRYSYKIHTKTHEGEKCYKCDLCPYASISARHLESHMLVHTDQKPFQCPHPGCDQAFRQKQLLKRHINLYHDPEYIPPPPKEKTHVCPSCDRQFRHKGNLIRHMALHDPDSTIREHAMALKVGRKKRIQFIDGQQVEDYGLEDEEEYEGEEDYEDYEKMDEDENFLPNKTDKTVMAVGQDGQRYMVVEVINMHEEENVGHLQLQERGELEEYILDPNMDNDALDPLQRGQDRGDSNSIEKDMSTCFGFVDEDVDVDEESEIDKSTIQLIDYVE